MKRFTCLFLVSLFVLLSLASIVSCGQGGTPPTSTLPGENLTSALPPTENQTTPFMLDEYQVTRTATYVVAASDAPAHVKAQADYVSDGVGDEAELNAAIAALPTANKTAGIWGGGLISLSGGNFYIQGEVVIDKDNVTIQGPNLGSTIIWVTANMTNSFLVKGNYAALRDFKILGSDFKILGNGHASQVNIQGAYISIYRMSIAYHTAYNLLIDGGSAITIDQSRFAGKPIKSTRDYVTISNTIHDGIGEEKSLLISGNRIAIVQNHFNDFAGDSIEVIGETHGLIIQNNWFNTTATAENLINVWNGSYGIMGASITGNSQGELTNVTNFVKIVYANEVIIEGNYILKPIYIDSIAGSFRITSLGENIQYNGQTGLSYIEKYQGGTRIIRQSAAPTSGTWSVGDTVWNTAPAAGGTPGWVCTLAGTPGTWKSMASLAP